MLDFHSVTLDDSFWIKERLAYKKDVSCEYCFGNIFAYGKVLDIYVADYEDCLITKYFDGENGFYAFPVGNGDIKKALLKIVEDAESNYKKSYIYGLSKKDAEFFKSVFGERFDVYENRDASDYVYNSIDLITLAGKKYQPKRNHISYFKKNFNWSYESITGDNISDCLEMSKKWLVSSPSEYKDKLEREYRIIKCVFDNYEALGFKGGLIRVDGEVVAYTMGEELDSETFCVHFEKAYSDMRGAYPLINQQFVENELSDYLYINREDDVGAQNLRKAKLSYYPCYLVDKFEVEIN